MEEGVRHTIRNIHRSHPRAARKVSTREHGVHYRLHPRRCIEGHFSSAHFKNIMFVQRRMAVGIRKPASRRESARAGHE